MNPLRHCLKASAAALVLIALVLVGRSHAAEEMVQFANPEHKVMYQQLLREYRCLKCQNQNLADSNASLAGDLRREIRGQIEAGKSQSDIESYLVARYGEFVLYRPRFNSKTLVLWIGPFVLLAIGLFSLVKVIGNKNKPMAGEFVDSTGSISSDSTGDLPSDLPDSVKLARARDLLRKH